MQITIGGGKPAGPRLSMSGGSQAVTRVISRSHAGEGNWRMFTACVGVADGIYLLVPAHIKIFALSALLYLIVIGISKLSYKHALIPLRDWLQAAWANVIREAETSAPEDTDISKPSVKRYTAIARSTAIVLRPSALVIPRPDAKLAKMDDEDGTETALALPASSTVLKHVKTAVKVPLIGATRVLTGKTIDPRYHHESTFHVRSKDFAMYRNFKEWWSRQAHRARLMMHGMLMAQLGLIMTYMTEDPASYFHTVTLMFACVTGILVSGAACVVGWRLVPWKTHRRTVIQPLADVLTDTIAVVKNPRVPRRFGADGAGPVIVHLPVNDKLLGKTKSEIQACVAMKTGLSDLVATWHTMGNEPYAVFNPLPQPPNYVGWPETRDLAIRILNNTKETRILIALGRGKEAIYHDNIGDNPHTAIGGLTGCGKSELMKMMMAQYAYRGDRVIIIDIKRISHIWAKDCPGIEYCKDITDISKLLRDLADEELAERTRLVDSGAWDSQVDAGRRIYIFIDELSSTITDLTEHWRNDGNRGPSPAVIAFRKILKLGRALKIYVEPADQSWDCNGVGGPQARENFGTRFVSRYSTQMWGKLCKEIKPMPRKSKVRGRWQMVTGGEATEIQAIYMTDAEARELVLAGNNVIHAEATRMDQSETWTADEPVPAVPTVPTNVLQASDQAIRSVPGTAGTDPDDPDAVLVTYKQYREQLEGLAVPTESAIKKRLFDDRSRAPVAVVPGAGNVGAKFRRTELHEWHRIWEAEHGYPVSTLRTFDE